MIFDKIQLVEELINISIEEDLKDGDPSSEIIYSNPQAKYNLILKEDAVISGIEVFKYIFKKIDKSINFMNFKEDSFYYKGVIGEIIGNESSILSAERTALNFIQRMSSVATATYNLKKLINNQNVQLIDTRKTIPGWRILDKYSVLVGGGKNHRMNLGELIMIKDNHYNEKNLSKIIENGKTKFPNLKIEVEVENFTQLKKVMLENVDIIMLDNWPINKVQEAIKMIRDKNKNILIEISGGIDSNNISEYAKYSPNFISSGSITHSPMSIDLSLEKD
ncbi:MAG: carboxylating nicotinate-nucleotide diphosphorylase [Chloroflexota bacterium]|jgi:nicotinate-nucleotide pyrophosphorylase (carboxylating)|nr:carboxylating nicotinate-nucleotide diphosphorylase [Chloroflexota bacterium]MEE2620665.1 carboxylating nicotinate-nucleotide diphosphorylase [Chloroflexota bacterium]|tara:strand:- start:1624 stop:2457 length:834 start_codon:yes stop_codon:yes gene_type:complete